MSWTSPTSGSRLKAGRKGVTVLADALRLLELLGRVTMPVDTSMKVQIAFE
ncbi:hypothetical protein MPL3365_40013 [Mesorhizobium plurifarium]|nr:hypothetical protein MPL3365_40013 [Mesorhizobium plurifarium]